MKPKLLIKEYYQLNANDFKTKKGSGFKLVYIDPNASTDIPYDNKEMLKQYKLEYLPYNRFIKYTKGIPNAWGWIVWDGRENEVYPFIKKFAEEIGQKETPPANGQARTVDEVLDSIEQIKDVILASQGSIPNGQGGEIIRQAEQLKDKLAKGIGSKDTMDALAELTRFRMEMKRHMGHPLSLINTILVWLQKRDATDVRSKGEWADMGYTPKEGAVGIILAMPARFKSYYGNKYKQIVQDFLKKEGVSLISDLTPSQKRRLDRETKYPDISAGFKDYVAYDISDMIAGENAEKFPENNFKWYDADSDETEKERTLISACVRFGESLGIKYDFVGADKLGGARGSASISGDINILDDKKNKGLLSTAIHETAHEIMHWDVVKTKNPKLEKFYRGRANRGSDIIEQEAELCAWIVLSGFGYENQQEHFNYLGNWGMTVENCKAVFDSIYKVAEYIYDGIEAQLNNNEVNDNQE